MAEFISTETYVVYSCVEVAKIGVLLLYPCIETC